MSKPDISEAKRMNLIIAEIQHEGPESENRKQLQKQKDAGILTKKRNKYDHVSGLLQVQGKEGQLPEHLKDNKLIKGEINSSYREMFSFTDDAKYELKT